MKKQFVLLLVASALMACGAPSPEDIAAKTGNDIEELVKGSITTARYTNSMQTRDEALTSIGISSSDTRYQVPEASSTDQSFADWKILTGRIFREENIIDRPAGAVVFALKGVDLCTPLRSAEPADPRCVQDIDRAQLALRGSGDVDLTLLVGPNRYEPVVLRVRSKQSLAVEIDLAQATLASDYLQTIFNQGSGPVTTTSGSGKVELKLERHADTDYSLRLSILEDVTVRVTDPDGIARVFTSKATQPLASLRVDGAARRISTELNAGPTEYQGLWSDWYSSASVSLRTPMVASLSGFHWSAVLQDGQNSHTVNVGLGSGQSSLTFAGQKVFALDLNESLGRRLEMEWTKSAAGAPLLKIKPGLHAQLFFKLQPVKDAGDSVSDDLLNATYAYSFLEQSGQVPSLEVLKPSNDGTWQGGVRLVSGQLTLSSNNPGLPSRSFSAGTCLTGFNGQSTNSMLDLFSAAACP